MTPQGDDFEDCKTQPLERLDVVWVYAKHHMFPIDPAAAAEVDYARPYPKYLALSMVRKLSAGCKAGCCLAISESKVLTSKHSHEAH